MEWKSAEQPPRPSWFSISTQPHQIIAEVSFTCFTLHVTMSETVNLDLPMFAVFLKRDSKSDNFKLY